MTLGLIGQDAPAEFVGAFFVEHWACQTVSLPNTEFAGH